MTYGYGDTDAVKNYFEVHLRSTKTFEDPQTTNQLRALANDLGGFGITILINTSTGADVDTNNSLYECDATSGAVSIDLAAEIIAGEVAGDILIFKATNVGFTVTITDENALATVLSHVNDVIVCKYSTKWEYWFMAHDGDTANQEDYFTEIGVLDEGPEIITEKGDTKTTSKGNELFSKKINFSTNDLQVNEANSDFYRSIVAAGNVDIMFYEPNYPNHSKFLLNFPLENYLNIKGNTWNTIPLSGSKEMANTDMSTYLKLFKDTSA